MQRSPVCWTSAHDRPLLQIPPATVWVPQQGCPTAPQAWQAAGGAPGGLMQAKPALHPLFAQQRCPLPPHGAHAWPPSPLFWQESPAAQAFAAPPVQQA